MPVIEHVPELPKAPITLQSPVEDHPLVKLSAVIESPLHEETKHLMNDAENALRFLSASFMPSKSLRDEVVNSLIGDKVVQSFDDEA